MKIELLISSGAKVLHPIPMQQLILRRYSQIRPAELSFYILNSQAESITEGCSVSVLKDGKNIFFGYIFEISKDKNFTYIVAYDQLRYLKNKDTYNLQQITASTLLKQIAEDFGLKYGEIDDTSYIIPSLIKHNQTLADIIQYSLDVTEKNTGIKYVLYDYCGKLTLKSENNLKCSTKISKNNSENITEESSVNNSYNKIKLAKTSKTSNGQTFVSSDYENIQKWGVLQHFENIPDYTNGPQYAKTLLNHYNKKQFTVNAHGVTGDENAYGGSKVNFESPSSNQVNEMRIEQVSHIFKCGRHSMDLTLSN